MVGTSYYYIADAHRCKIGDLVFCRIFDGQWQKSQLATYACLWLYERGEDCNS